MEGLQKALEGALQSGSPVALVVAFAAGFLISFTPCVFPVIPIIMAYVGGQAKGSRRKSFMLSVLYVLGMAVTYSALGAVASLTKMWFGQLQSHPAVPLAVGILILAVGLSLLGVYRLPVPRLLSGGGRAGHARRGGMLGAFMMGLVSGFVVAPCSAAVLFALLAFVAEQGNVVYGMLLLFSFALGMGVLLVAIGTFTGLMASLPKPGRWMERVERGFGVLTVLLGLFFIGKAVNLWLK